MAFQPNKWLVPGGAASQQRKNNGPGIIPKKYANRHNSENSELAFAYFSCSKKVNEVRLGYI